MSLCPYVPMPLCPRPPVPETTLSRRGAPLCCTISNVRKWWVGFGALLYAAAVSAATTKEAPIATAQVTPELRASLTHDYEIDVVVKPHGGDAWTRLAKRVTGDAERWHDIATFNQ